jgi:signal transduction histidine kinase
MSTDLQTPNTPQWRLEQLVTTGTLLASELSLEGVLQRVVEIAVDVIGAKYAAIGVLGPDGRTLESFTTMGLTDEERAAIGPPPRGHGILGLVVRAGQPIRLSNLGEHPDSYGFPPNHPPMNSFLGVPIIGRRGTFGNLYLTEKIGGPEFTDVDEYVARLLATQTAAAVENARLHEESARLLEEVQQLQRTRERFCAMVNHELRNALAGVSGWAEMLVRKMDPATVPRAAFEVLDSAEQAIALINDLLDLSRLDEDRLKPALRSVEPAGVVRRSIGRVTPAAQARNVTIRAEVPAGLPSCHTDANRVEQILINLAVNAVRHTPEHTEICISVRHEGKRLLFEVEDQGPGIPESELERIFDIYITRAGDAQEGVGLGLPLSRRLARLLGGELRAVPNPGGGGRFVLELPAAAPE